MRVALLALVVASSAFAQDADLDAARKFLVGRPELASLVSKAADQESPGVYKLKLDAPAPATWVVKRGSAWAVRLFSSQLTPAGWPAEAYSWFQPLPGINAGIYVG